ncbi:MAG: hypothetical protein CBC84_000020 [Pelagibacteraceae bacterium TMED124]|nr:MAG: hypothetical protein CBC84_000020 [Pelagibacteraceae bacterium TMED124]|tara:strand:- start:1210 stop:2343 length:1134 start_codon:yes stop_codon:yes gene_type:complete
MINKLRNSLKYFFNYKVLILFLTYIPNLFILSASTKTINLNKGIFKNSFNSKKIKYINSQLISDLKWEKTDSYSEDLIKIEWEKYNRIINKRNNKINIYKKTLLPIESKYSINSLNRSIVIGKNIGPDIGWLIPPGFKWTKRKKVDTSLRGYNQTLSHRRKKSEGWGWNKGDAVGQFYYQFLNKDRYSFGSNIGIRSVSPAHDSPIGDGLSVGFRGDYKLSSTSGVAIGAEQLIHFDEFTDTGRDLYVTISKAFWNGNKEGQFPLKIATGGFATGRMAEGNINGLCSDLFGGAATEVQKKRRLCWAPVFSLAYLFNDKLSTFFEYNSRFFLLGSSFVPFKEKPLRGTFALTISDHIHNYKVNNFDEMTWTFRISLGF